MATVSQQKHDNSAQQRFLWMCCPLFLSQLYCYNTRFVCSLCKNTRFFFAALIIKSKNDIYANPSKAIKFNVIVNNNSRNALLHINAYHDIHK